MLAIVARSLLALAAAAGPKAAPAPTAPPSRPLTLGEVQGIPLKTLQELTSITGIASSRMVRVGSTAPADTGPVRMRLDCPSVVEGGSAWFTPPTHAGCEHRMGFWLQFSTERDADYLVQCNAHQAWWRFRYYEHFSSAGPSADPLREGRSGGTGDVLFHFRARDTRAAIHVRPELAVPYDNRAAVVVGCQVVRVVPLTTPKG